MLSDNLGRVQSQLGKWYLIRERKKIEVGHLSTYKCGEASTEVSTVRSVCVFTVMNVKTSSQKPGNGILIYEIRNRYAWMGT